MEEFNWGEEEECWGEETTWGGDDTFFPQAPPKQVFVGKNESTSVSLSSGDEHSYLILGRPGSGKTYFLYMLAQAIIQGKLGESGALILSPHPDLFEWLMQYCASRPELARRVVVVSPSDFEEDGMVLGFRGIPVPKNRQYTNYVVESVVSMIFRIFKQDAAEYPRINKWLRLTLYPIFYHGKSIVEALRFLYDGDFRNTLLSEMDEPEIFAEWQAFSKLPLARREELIEGVKNRLEPFISSPPVRKMLIKSGFSLETAMEQGLIVLVKLTDEAPVSAIAAQFVGSLLLDEVLRCGRTRNLFDPNLKPFRVIVDEFPVFRGASPAMSSALVELRKFKVFFSLAAQTLYQLKMDDETLYFNALSGCKTKIIFSVAREDSENLAKEMYSGHLDYHEIKDEIHSIRTKLIPEIEELTIESWTEDVAARSSVSAEQVVREVHSKITEKAHTTGKTHSDEVITGKEQSTTRGKESSSHDETSESEETYTGNARESGTQHLTEQSTTEKTAEKNTTGNRQSEQRSKEQRRGQGTGSSVREVDGEKLSERSRQRSAGGSDVNRTTNETFTSDEHSTEKAKATKSATSQSRKEASQEGERSSSGTRQVKATVEKEGSSEKETSGTRRTEASRTEDQERQSEGTSTASGRAIKASAEASEGVKYSFTTTQTKYNRPEEVSELRSRTFYSVQELWEQLIGNIMNQKTGQATLKIGENAPIRVQISAVKPPYFDPIRTPLEIADFKRRVFAAHSEFYSPYEEPLNTPSSKKEEDGDDDFNF